VPDYRAERTSYLGLLALMLAQADTENWSYPYWNVRQIDAALSALAQAARDGTVPLLAPQTAPTAAVSATTGSIASGVALEIGQTWVDEFGRETELGPVATVSTGEGITSPAIAPALGTPTLGDLSGYEGGLLEVWFSWTDGAGGETLASPSAQVDVPYQAGGLRSEVEVTLPSAPAAAGASGANIYLRHRGGNIVLAYRILADDVDEITLTGAVADCYRSLPLANSFGSGKAIDITGIAAPAGAALTRFYLRTPGASWPAADRRLKLNGFDEWDPTGVTYPLVYTGATDQLTAGFPPTVSQVKAIRPVDLSTEAIGELPAGLLPAVTTLEMELVRSIGQAVMSGLEASAHAPADMGVHIASGEALLTAGRFLPAADDCGIPVADLNNPRIDVICLSDSGAIEGPAENVALKGAPAASPTPPATPSGYLKLAEVLVGAGATSIAADKITDARWVVPTLVAAVLEFRAADGVIAGDLSDHEADTDFHASKAGTIATVETSCAAGQSSDFVISNVPSCLLTEVRCVATSSGSLDYDLYFYSDASRTTLQYQAGNGSGEGVQVATYVDRIPWEWFGISTVYARMTNYALSDISNAALSLKYRR